MKPLFDSKLPLVASVTFIGFLDTHLLIPVVALYAGELGAGLALTGVIVGLYSITNTPANIIFGRWIDRIGYRRPLTIGLIGSALSMFVYAITALPLHLALLRVVHGTTGALIGPATMSATAAWATRNGRGRTMGIYGMAIAAATLVGYGVSTVLLARFDFYAIFYLGGGLLLFGAALTRLLPPSPPVSPAERGARGGWSALGGLLKRRGLVTAYAAVFTQYFTFGGLVTLLPSYLKSLGLPNPYTGVLLATFAFCFFAVQVPSGRLSDRRGRRLPLALGLLIGTVALAALPVLTTLMLLIIAMAAYGVAYGLLFPAASALVTDNSRPDERGLTTGVFHALFTSGVAIGAPVSGWLGQLTGVSGGLFALSCVMGAALLVVLFITRRSKFSPGEFYGD